MKLEELERRCQKSEEEAGTKVEMTVMGPTPILSIYQHIGNGKFKRVTKFPNDTEASKSASVSIPDAHLGAVEKDYKEGNEYYPSYNPDYGYFD